MKWHKNSERLLTENPPLINGSVPAANAVGGGADL